MPAAAVTGPETTATDELVRRARGFASRRAAAGQGEVLPAPPALRVAVLACMDARLDVAAVLGLPEGAAHVIRNAGGVVTDDAVRSLAISQHELGTREIVLIQHTRCGMQTITDEGFRDLMESRTGSRPEWPVLAFRDLEENVRESVEALAASPYLRQSTSVRGFVYDVAAGSLHEVAAARPAAAGDRQTAEG
ncbi:carbonic anhydrase [Frankia sp. CNm7]|nr:carbonic anhydrase [Frankia nepalensis]MBL7510969.1 carbonic anhydrase [Frankia nepalensis]MBL7519667.1 carbonic anhydrase [Frankia nepalensis]